MLEKNYKKIKELGQGTSSKVFLVEGPDQSTFIVKECIKRHPLKWLRNCRREANISQKLKNDAYEVGEIHIDRINKEFVIWGKFVKGQQLTPELVKKIPEKKKEKLKIAFAEFLYDIHGLKTNSFRHKFAETKSICSRAILEKVIEFQRTYICRYKKTTPIFTRKKFKNYQKSIYSKFNLSNAVQQKFEKLIRFLIKQKHVWRELETIYRDFHCDNILYDKASGKLGIIDFGTCAYTRCLYLDFGSLLELFPDDSEFTHDILTYYNKKRVKDNKPPLHWDIIKLFGVVQLFQSLHVYPEKLDRFLKQLDSTKIPANN